LILFDKRVGLDLLSRKVKKAIATFLKKNGSIFVKI
jgi:hypothetical protein